jgi:hypothetical protein
MHRPGIEPGASRWQRLILPLNHRCFDWLIDEGVSDNILDMCKQSGRHRRFVSSARVIDQAFEAEQSENFAYVWAG